MHYGIVAVKADVAQLIEAVRVNDDSRLRQAEAMPDTSARLTPTARPRDLPTLQARSFCVSGCRRMYAST